VFHSRVAELLGKRDFPGIFMSRSKLNFLGVVILVVGLGCVGLIEHNVRVQEANAVDDTEETHALLHPEDSREYVRNAEMIGGKLGLLVDGWCQSLEDLGHSRRFAITIAVLSLGAATAAFTKSAFSVRE